MNAWTMFLIAGLFFAGMLGWMALAQWARAQRPGNPVDFPFAYGRDPCRERPGSRRDRRPDATGRLSCNHRYPRPRETSRRRTIDYPYMDAKLVERPRRR